MRDYSKIGPKFWIGATGKRLREAGMEAQIVAMYLLTSPHANMLGLYYCPLMFIAHETGMGIEGASKGLRSSIEAGFCQYDEASEVVWVIEMATYQIGESLSAGDKRVKGVQNEYDSLPGNPYLTPFFDKYGHAFRMAFCRGEASPIEGASKGHRSQEQEQEQEQEQKQERDETPPRGRTQVDPGFVADEPNRRTAFSLGLDVEAERERFVAHYTATGDWRANWQSQFRKWLLDSMQHQASRARRAPQRRPETEGFGTQEYGQGGVL